MKIEEATGDDSLKIDQQGRSTSDDTKVKFKTNLEILLSQNDILPLLKKINKETKYQHNNNKGVFLSNYLSGSVKLYFLFLRKNRVMLEDQPMRDK